MSRTLVESEPAQERRTAGWVAFIACAALVFDGYDLTITNRQGVQKTVYTKGVSGRMLFPVMNFDPATGILTISGLQQEVDRIRYDYETAELIISFPNV